MHRANTRTPKVNKVRKCITRPNLVWMSGQCYIDPDGFGPTLSRIHQYSSFMTMLFLIRTVPNFLKSLKQPWLQIIISLMYQSLKVIHGDWRSDPDAGPRQMLTRSSSGNYRFYVLMPIPWYLKTHLSRSQFLVINDNYNSDWHAFINGHQVRLLRANVSFKGLWVPSGESSDRSSFFKP